eukprot:maker-scaffold109_size355148-snap-gene-1.24 protein:Tk11027 transcript:maker-scaffold109_size355148-snap-gene-1.24-mRNA-1 annotation:"PREDICTED: uncharacterized protein LOC100868639"
MGPIGTLRALLCLLIVAPMGGSWALPTIYHVGEEGEADAIQIAVSSTVIPLDDLPEFQVGIGFGLTPEKDKIKKPANLKDIQLITAKNRHRFVAAAGVQELTKEEFDQFNVS